MLFVRLVILTLVSCGAERSTFPVVRTRPPAHTISPVITASFQHARPVEDSDAPLLQEEEDLDSDTDCTDAALGPAALPPDLAPPVRPSSLERTLPLSGSAELLYSLKRLRI